MRDTSRRGFIALAGAAGTAGVVGAVAGLTGSRARGAELAGSQTMSTAAKLSTTSVAPNPRLVIRRAERLIGGFTGDILGASIILIETTALVAATAS